jgi:DNA-binding MarR family transcriptional regulator
MNLDSPTAQTVLATARRENAAAERRCRALFEWSAASRALHAALQRELARAGLTETGFAVLAMMFANRPRPVLRADLRIGAGLSPARMNDALIRLELSGLVQRRRDPRDRRLAWLQLTSRGAGRIAAALKRYVSAAEVATGRLDRHEIEISLVLSGGLRAGAARLAGEHFTSAAP